MEVAFGQKGWAQLSIVIEVDVMVDEKDYYMEIMQMWKLHQEGCAGFLIFFC